MLDGGAGSYGAHEESEGDGLLGARHGGQVCGDAWRSNAQSRGWSFWDGWLNECRGRSMFRRQLESYRVSAEKRSRDAGISAVLQPAPAD